MELYEHARPGLLAGKKLLYVHGFASSGQTGSVRTLRLLLPDADIIAPDVPVEPHEAIDFLKETVSRESPDVIIGTSMGGMYSEMLYGTFRILVPARGHHPEEQRPRKEGIPQSAGRRPDFIPGQQGPAGGFPGREFALF